MYMTARCKRRRKTDEYCETTRLYFGAGGVSVSLTSEWKQIIRVVIHLASIDHHDSGAKGSRGSPASKERIWGECGEQDDLRLGIVFIPRQRSICVMAKKYTSVLFFGLDKVPSFVSLAHDLTASEASPRWLMHMKQVTLSGVSPSLYVSSYINHGEDCSSSMSQNSLRVQISPAFFFDI